MGLLDTLKRIDAENEKALEEKFIAKKRELVEGLTATEHDFFCKETFAKDIEGFVNELDKSVVLDGKLAVLQVKGKWDFDAQAKVKEIHGVDYLLCLEQKHEGNYVLKLWLKDLRQRIKSYMTMQFQFSLNDEAVEEIYGNLDEDGNIIIKLLPVKDFITLLEEIGEEKAMYLPSNPETSDEVCHGVISRGEMKACLSARGNVKTLMFTFKAKG